MKNAENGLSNYNYVTLQGWMIKELDLKGNELIVYSVVYGFSQNEDNCFWGSSKYLMEWCHATKATIINTLKSLCDKGLLIKCKIEDNNNRVGYKINREVLNFDAQITECQDTSTSNKQGEKFDLEINEIVNYLNQVCNKHYRTNIQKTRSVIKARLSEGFTVDDFKAVINFKNAQWSKDSKMKDYLRPETLFGSKFEGYLNSCPQKFTKSKTQTIETVPEVEQEMTDEEWLEMMEKGSLGDEI